LYLLFLTFGGRIVTTIHTVPPLSAFRLKLTKHRFVAPLNKAIVTYWLLNIKIISWLSKKVIVLTQAAKSTLEEGCGVRNAICIPISCYKAQPVDAYEAESFRKKISLEHGQKVVVLFGSPSREKGFHHVIEALPEVVRKIPGVKLFVAGGTPRSSIGHLRSLEESAKRLNVEKSVMFFGRVSRQDMPYIISNTDIAIFPYEKEWSVSGSGALQEVLAYLKPIIVSDTPPFALLKNGETCLKVNVADNDELAKAIISLLSDRELHDNIVENLRRFVEEYSVTNEAMQCLRIYEEALD
jgi:glycosyltransferase involved in cell wall biosynthesis